MEESKDVNMGCEYKVSPAVSDDGGVCLSSYLVLEERPTASLPGAWRTMGRLRNSLLLLGPGVVDGTVDPETPFCATLVPGLSSSKAPTSLKAIDHTLRTLQSDGQLHVLCSYRLGLQEDEKALVPVTAPFLTTSSSSYIVNKRRRNRL